MLLWAAAGVIVAGYVVARYDRAVTDSVTSVREIVSFGNRRRTEASIRSASQPSGPSR